MKIQDAINDLRETAKQYNANFINDQYFESIMPESAKEIHFDELCRLREIVGHDIACLREFIDLANDKLASFTMSNDLQIGIINPHF